MKTARRRRVFSSRVVTFAIVPLLVAVFLCSPFVAFGRAARRSDDAVLIAHLTVTRRRTPPLFVTTPTPTAGKGFRIPGFATGTFEATAVPTNTAQLPGSLSTAESTQSNSPAPVMATRIITKSVTAQAISSPTPETSPSNGAMGSSGITPGGGQTEPRGGGTSSGKSSAQPSSARLLPALAAGAVLLGIAASAAVFLLRRRRRPAPASYNSLALSEARPETPPALPVIELRSTPPPMGTPYLCSLGHVRGGTYVPLDRTPLGIGRAKAPSNALLIDEHFAGWPTVSACHAQIEKVDQDWLLVDLKSRNGVFVDGLRTGENVLTDGCTIAVGTVQFTFHLNIEGA